MKYSIIEIGRSNPKVISVYNCGGCVVMLKNKITPSYNGYPLIAVFKTRYYGKKVLITRKQEKE